MGFSKQEYWSRLPCPPPGDLPTQGSNTGLQHCRILYCLSHESETLICDLSHKFNHFLSPWGKKKNTAEPTLQFSSVQLLSRVWLSATPWTAARQASLSIIISRSSLKLTCIKSVMPSSHLILCHPFILLSSVPPSIRVFSNVSTLCMMWPKYWSFLFSIIPSKGHPGLISFRMDWLDLLAVPGTLQESSTTPQFRNINSSVHSFLWGPTLTSIHDYWKNHRFD